MFYISNDCAMYDPFEYPGLRILLLFFDNPYREFYLREIAKLGKLSPSTCKRYLDFYSHRGLIMKSRKANLILFRASTESPPYRHLKIGIFLLKAESLFDFLRKEYEGCSVILYGSCARGEDGPESDIDLLIVGRTSVEIDLAIFERQLNRKITLEVYTTREWEERARADRPFYERVLIDGIVIFRNMPVVQA